MPTIVLCLFLLASNTIEGAYAGQLYPHEPSLRNARIFEYIVIWLLIGWWLNSDSKRMKSKLVQRIWPWSYLIWPLIMPYYLWKTRRVKGILPVIAFVGVFLLTAFIGGLVYTIFIF